MRIHHLNCGSMNPAGIPLTTRELGHRVVLIDSGFGTAYVQQPDDPSQHVGDTATRHDESDRHARRHCRI